MLDVCGGQAQGLRNWGSLRRRGEGRHNHSVRESDDLRAVVCNATDRVAVQRIAFFQTAAQESTERFNISSIQRLIDTYLARDSTELSTLQASRRPGRPTSTREDTLKQQMNAEAKEYVSGLWIPDMEDPETVEKLRGWSGEWMNLNTLRFARVKQDGTRHASSFPPKGQS
ncbi:MAG: hypothetical protein Q9173_007069 [Seirophora scorigena]